MEPVSLSPQQAPIMAHSDSQPSPTASSQLVPLSRLPSFRMADGEPDVRGWPVVAADGGALGRVVELLVDPATSEIAAVLVATPQADSAQGGGRSVLPMEHVHIDDRQDRLIADAAGLTGYADGAQSTSTTSTTSTAGGGDATVGTIAGATSGADLSRATTSRDANGDEVIRVPVVEERLVIEKRPVVTEMLVIRKRTVQTNQVVEADLRRERVEIDQRDFRDGQQRPPR
jgi:hypothetical protein